MRLAVSFDYAAPPLPQVEDIARWDALGVDQVWVPEAYGYDAPTVMGFLAARTRRMDIVAGVLPVHTRSPALIAQTAAALDVLSDGRFELGLGTSGPVVVEGFHGVPFTAPLARMRTVIDTCRAMWHRQPPPGSALRPILGPGRPDIPIHLATLRPGGVALAAELADGWYPLFAVPERIRDTWGEALDRGHARRNPDLGPLRVTVGLHVGLGDGAPSARASARREVARYVGGMGPRGGNFYTELVGRLGWPEAADAIQTLFLAGRRDEAEAAVPEDMLDAFTLTGPDAVVAARLAAFGAAGVHTLVARGLGVDADAQLARLRALMGPS